VALTKVAETLASEQSTTDLAVIEQELRTIARQELRIADAIAAADSSAAADVLVRKLNELAQQRDRLQQEQVNAQNQAVAREAARRGFEQLQEQFRHMLENIDDLDYDGKRDILEQLGMRVEVHRDEPGVHRLIITADPNRDASARALDLMSVRSRSPSDPAISSSKSETLLSTAEHGVMVSGPIFATRSFCSKDGSFAPAASRFTCAPVAGAIMDTISIPRMTLSCSISSASMTEPKRVA